MIDSFCDFRVKVRAGNDSRGPQGARSFFRERILEGEETIKAKLAEFFVVRLSIRLVRLRHLHFRARTRESVRFSRTEIESRCCAHAALCFSLLSRLSAGIFRAADDLRTTTTTRKDCLQNCTGRETRRTQKRTTRTRETKMKRDRDVINEAPSLRFFSRGNSGEQ